MPADGADATGELDEAGSSGKQLVEEIAFAEAPVVTTAEIASVVSGTHDQVYYRLRKLEAGGLVESKKIGGNRAWWCTNAGVKYLKGSLDPSEVDLPEWVEVDHYTSPTTYGSQDRQWRRQRSLL